MQATAAAPAPTMDSLVRHNARQFYLDIFWYGVLAGSTQAFWAVYAARLGASSFQLALLTAGPAVINLFVSLPAARWLEGRSLVRAVLHTSLWHRAGYLFIVILPWVLAPALQVWALPATIVLMSIPGTILAISFNAMFADVVPPEWRATVVGRRNALLALSMSGTSLFCGWLLELPAVPFPLNYTVVFALGAAGALMSSVYLARLRAAASPPPRVNRPLFDFARPGLFRFGDVVRLAPGLRFMTRGGGGRLVRLDMLRGPFGPFLLAFFLFYTFQYIPIPLFPLFLVNELSLGDGTISVGNAMLHGANLLISLRLDRVTRRFSTHRVLTLSAILYGLYPLLIGLAGNATLYWAASILGGAIWALAGGALVTRLMERVPEADRPAHMAMHNLALNVGILAGSLAGPLLGDWVGVREAILISGGLRMLGGLLLAVWG